MIATTTPARLALLLSGIFAGVGVAEPTPQPVLDDGRLAVIRLTITPANWEIMTDSWRSVPRGEHPYVPADFEWDGERVRSAGIRLKGNNSLHRSKGNKFPFKVDFDRFVPEQEFQGLKKINLHNNSVDDSNLREYLSYGVWRAHGMPASRTGFAEVWLNGENLGLYTVVEQVDRRFLLRNFGHDDGDLYKPEHPAGTLEWFGDDISAYENLGHKRRDGTDHAAFLHLVNVINHGEAGDFSRVLDVENVLTYFAGNVALGNDDNYVSKAHNYYLYEKSPRLFAMIPWDMNLSQSPRVEIFPGGRYQPGQGGPVPHREQRPLLDRLMNDDTYRHAYLLILESLLEGPGSREALYRRIDAAEALLQHRLDDSAVNLLRRDIGLRVAELRMRLASLLARASFIRGDCDGDARVTGRVTDSIFLLNELFAGGNPSTCRAACDTNGDGGVNITDAVHLLSFNFLGGPPPVKPFPECGPGELATDAILGCDEAPKCP